MQEVTFHFLFDSFHVQKPGKSGSTMVYNSFNQPFGARKNTWDASLFMGPRQSKTVLNKKHSLFLFLRCRGVFCRISQLPYWCQLHQHKRIVLLHVSYGILWRWSHVCWYVRSFHLPWCFIEALVVMSNRRTRSRQVNTCIAASWIYSRYL